MKIEIAPEVFELFPGYVRHVLLVDGADNTGEHAALGELLARAQNAVRADDAFTDLKGHPRIAAWRSAFERFGVNPNRCPPSVAGLIKRVRSGKDLPYVNTLVCIFNIVSLGHVLPAGGDDLDKVVGDVRLGLTSGSETYLPLGSADAAEHPKPGEVILYDTGNGEVFCRAWCWKNGDRSRIEATTGRVAINIDALPPLSAAEGRAAAEQTSELVCRFCGARVAIHTLTRDNRQIDPSGFYS